MKIWQRYLIVLVTLIVASGAAYGYYQYDKAHSSSSDIAQVRMTVYGLGDSLVQVPLSAPADVVAFAMDKYYALYVHPDLLAAWKVDPKNAPGRLTSSPSPDRIDITSAVKNEDGSYTVDAAIVEKARAAATTTAASTIPVRFTLALGPDGWQITGYEKR